MYGSLIPEMNNCHVCALERLTEPIVITPKIEQSGKRGEDHCPQFG